jgi:hypothetical protein
MFRSTYYNYADDWNNIYASMYDVPYNASTHAKYTTGGMYEIMRSIGADGKYHLPYYDLITRTAGNIYPKLSRQLIPRLYRDLAPDVRIYTLSILRSRHVLR